MSEHRQSILEYLRASEALSKIKDFTAVEMQAIENVLDDLTEKLLSDGESS